MNRFRPACSTAITACLASLLMVACGNETPPADHASPAPQETVATAGISSGERAYLENCAKCHDRAVYKAPSRLFLGMLGPANILQAMNGGVMSEQAVDIDPAVRQEIAEFLTGVSMADLAAPVLPPECSIERQPAFDLEAPVQSLGWGVDPGNSRFFPADFAGLGAEDTTSLEVKWAFAYPNAIQARSQPLLAGGMLFVGGQSGAVWALDAETGCLHWQFETGAEVRTGIVISPWDGSGDASPTLYFGDIIARTWAIDAISGELRWMRKVDGHPSATITGTPALSDGKLFVPVSSLEVALPGDPAYTCCTFRGSLLALNAWTGEEEWKSYTIDQEPHEVGTTRAGKPILAPSGAPIWNSPTVDPVNRRVYAGTGENYSSPAGDSSDAIIAFDMDSGEKIWISQQTAGDAWNVACLSQYTTDDSNCPEEDGPDFDFAASTMLLSLPAGQPILVAGQKSGAVIGLDPETGETIWKTQVGRGGVQGGVHFGMAAEGSRIYVPISDMFYPEDITKYKFESPARPGMYAVNAADGSLLWSSPADDVCNGMLYCNPGISQAATAIPGAVIAGHMDGRLRIYSGQDGSVLWELNTLQDFPTVSGEIARGGSLGGGGAAVANGMIYINSGYGLYFHMPGNLLLAIGPKQKEK